MRSLLSTILASFVIAMPAPGQTTPRGGAVLGVFLDCNAPNCDSGHIRNEITFVNWVREASAADVHVLITSQGTGSGGRNYLLAFVGAGSFADDSSTLELSTPQGIAPAEARDLLTNRIAQGLMRYAAHTTAARRIRIAVVVNDPGEEEAPISQPDDAWNAWVFSTRVSGSMNGESRDRSRNFSMDAEASRITSAWKLEISTGGNYRHRRFALSSGDYVDVTRDWEVEAYSARSLARLWSAGMLVAAGSSTFQNQELTMRAAPAIEFSLVPYEDFSRRRATLRYSVGANHFRYAEETLFGEFEEQRWDQALELAVNYRQLWGSARTTIRGAHYLHDPRLYSVSATGSLDIRLFRGLSLDLTGSYSRVNDQLYLPKGDVSDEEVLLRRRALATTYRYRSSFGVRYTFGSIYNNVVNPRLGSGRW